MEVKFSTKCKEREILQLCGEKVPVLAQIPEAKFPSSHLSEHCRNITNTHKPKTKTTPKQHNKSKQPTYVADAHRRFISHLAISEPSSLLSPKCRFTIK